MPADQNRRSSPSALRQAEPTWVCAPHPTSITRQTLQPATTPVIIASTQEKRELRHAAREYTGAALETLVKVCTTSASDAARVSAANALLDRGYGKPVQQIESGSPGDFSHLTDEELDAMIAENMPSSKSANDLDIDMGEPKRLCEQAGRARLNKLMRCRLPLSQARRQA